MMNTTKNEIVFLHSEIELQTSAPRALLRTCALLSRASGLEQVDLATVSSKTNRELLFAKYSHMCTLKNKPSFFNQEYIRAAYAIYLAGRASLGPAEFETLTGASNYGFEYVKTSASGICSGIGAFLLQLHIDGALILPAAFMWPTVSGGEYGLVLDCQLLKLVRSSSASCGVNHKSFDYLPDSKYGRANFLSCATKLILALNWKSVGDANMEDIVQLELENQRTGNIGHACGHSKALILFLERFFGDEVDVSGARWDEHLTGKDRRAVKLQKKLGGPDAVSELNPFTVEAITGSEEYMKVFLEPSVLEQAQGWLTLQKIYLKRQSRRRENNTLLLCLQYLNLYLFVYLPNWFRENPSSAISFPSEPAKLISSIFVSSLLDHEFVVPLTLSEFLFESAETREWSQNVHYAYLKGIEGFFEYLERHSSELPGCLGFKQPLSQHDYPLVTGSRGTNKRPIPRRIFSFYLLYIESLLAFSQVVTARVLDGTISQEQVLETFENGKSVVFDTLRLADLVGFVPTVFWQGRQFRLQFIPNCLLIEEKLLLKDGRVLKIPQIHGLVHVLVALYTGIRNQHIQWLDERSFDKLAQYAGDFTLLHVNTDKVKTKPWSPHVNQRVISALREQKAWRGLVDMPSFDEEFFYGHNPKTKWAKIKPLFATGPYGHPHSDSRYQTCWDNILMGVQGMLGEIGHQLKENIDPLFELLPQSVSLDAEDTDELRRELYGDVNNVFVEGGLKYVQLLPKGLITPHSARVGVVSQYIQVLPADIIGKYITGQEEGVVYHYAVLDRADVERARDVQAVALQLKIFGQDLMETKPGGLMHSARHIKADSVNSAFVRSIASGRIEETIESFGCISITVHDDGKSGIDVLKSTRGSGASFNKTELCPYGNNCPPEIIKKLKGFRRCGICPYAVRSVEHLPAVSACRKQMAEKIEELEERLAVGGLSGEESDQFEAERQRLGSEATGYRLSEEVLERQRRLISEGKDTRRWAVAAPEIILQGLSQIAVPSDEVSYLMARLSECVAYPAYDSPSIRGKFDLLRRQLLAGSGRVREAFAATSSGNPALECIGILKSVADAHGISYSDIPVLIQEISAGNVLPAAANYFLPRSTPNGE